jgi:uncharacterized RmlC-like cupin family protein
MSKPDSSWRDRGVRIVHIVHKDQLDSNTPQTPGMNRLAAITKDSANARKIRAGIVDTALFELS